jgi:hypothetical protein
MYVGIDIAVIPEERLLEDYYTNLHGAYRAMHDAFEMRADAGLTQDGIAIMLGVDKSLISKRFNGMENMTLKTMSYMGTAMNCRVTISFTPYESVCMSNYYQPTQSINNALIMITSDEGGNRMSTVNSPVERENV